jgi:hypothetical protein
MKASYIIKILPCRESHGFKAGVLYSKVMNRLGSIFLATLAGMSPAARVFRSSMRMTAAR